MVTLMKAGSLERRRLVHWWLGRLVVAGSLLYPMLAIYGVPIGPWQFEAADPVITFETGSTGLPSISGVQFSGGDASFYWPSPSPPGFGAQYFGNLNGATYLDIYFDQPQQAVGAYLIGANKNAR